MHIGLMKGYRDVRRYSSSELDGRELVGMYGGWTNRALPDARLEAVGVLSKQCSVYRPSSHPEESTDTHGFTWDPVALPGSLTEYGRLLGECTYEVRRQTYRYPQTGCTVSWLDCSRIIEEVEVALVHPTSRERLPVDGVALQYADGKRERVSVGYFPMSDDDTWPEGPPENCVCRENRYYPLAEDAGSYCRSERWRPGGHRLRAVRVWMDKHGALSGMQFMARSGNESHLWGFASDNGTSGTMSLSGETDDSHAVGIKFFMNGNGRSVTYDDVVIVGMQAVVKAQ